MNNLKFLRSADILGIDPFFLIKTHKSLHTSLGGCVSIFLFLVMILVSIFFSQEFFQHINPNINQSEEPFPNPSKIYYDYKNFHFMIGIQDKDNNMFIDPSIYYPEGDYKTIIINSTGTYYPVTILNMTFCNNTVIDPEIKNLYEDIDINKFYCLSDVQPVNKNEMYLNDVFGHDKFRMLQVKFYKCKTNCKTEEEIEQGLFNAMINIYIVSHKVQTRDFNNPIQFSKQSYFFPVSKNTKTAITHYLHHMEVESDTNILFTSRDIVSSFQHGRVFEQVYSGVTSSSFASYTFQLNNILEKYYRKYYKIQDFVAQVGGILIFVKFACLSILYIYNENSFIEYLINFYFDIIPSEKDKNHFKQGKRIYFVNNPSPQIPTTNTKENEIDHIDNTINNDKTSVQNGNEIDKINSSINNSSMIHSKNNVKKEPINKKRFWSVYSMLNFRVIDRLFLMTMCPKNTFSKNKKAYKYFFKGKKKIKDKLEFVNYLQMSFDINALQTFLLKEEENNLLHVICKPILTGDRKNNVVIDKRNNYTQISRKQAEELVNENIKKKKDLEINQKLLDFINGTKHLYSFQEY